MVTVFTLGVCAFISPSVLMLLFCADVKTRARLRCDISDDNSKSVPASVQTFGSLCLIKRKMVTVRVC